MLFHIPGCSIPLAGDAVDGGCQLEDELAQVERRASSPEGLAPCVDRVEVVPVRRLVLGPVGNETPVLGGRHKWVSENDGREGGEVELNVELIELTMTLTTFSPPLLLITGTFDLGPVL